MMEETITSLNIDAVNCTDPQLIKDHIFVFFKTYIMIQKTEGPFSACYQVIAWVKTPQTFWSLISQKKKFSRHCARLQMRKPLGLMIYIWKSTELVVFHENGNT